MNDADFYYGAVFDMHVCDRERRGQVFIAAWSLLSVS